MPDTIAKKIVQKLQVLEAGAQAQTLLAESFRYETKQNYERMEGKIDSVLKSIDHIRQVEAKTLENVEAIALLEKSNEKQWSRIDAIEDVLKPLQADYSTREENRKEIFKGLILPTLAGVGVVGMLALFGLLVTGITAQYLEPSTERDIQRLD